MSDAEFQRGREEGRVDEVLRQHGAHLERINGSIDDSTEALLRVASELRELREAFRLRDERVETARSTLATEAERRRTQLADSQDADDRRFTRGEKLGGLAVGAAGLVAAGLKFLG